MTEKPEWEKIDDILAKPDSEITDDEWHYLAESVGWDYDRQRSYDDIDENQKSPPILKVDGKLSSEGDAETVRIFRIKMLNEDLPELILNSLDDLNNNLEYTFFGEDKMWEEFEDGTTLTITIDTMPKSKFDALKEWED